MSVILKVAYAHLVGRKRQTFVALGGVTLGVAFFLAVSALMRGSESDFLKRLVDNAPHITVYDEVRHPEAQPAALRWPDAALQLPRVKPQRETRGIRGWPQRVQALAARPGVRVAPVLAGAVVLSFAGRVQGLQLSGIQPQAMKGVSTIEDKMVEGSLDSLESDPNGIVLGAALMQQFQLRRGGTVSVVSANGASRTLKIVGVFRTGNQGYDEGQAFVKLERAQSLLGRENRANRLILQLDDPQAAATLAPQIEREGGYKAVSWTEASQDILALLVIRNLIMYTVVSAILVVASLGIYNTLSTVALEKTRDIAILKSMGFHARELQHIFLLQGLAVGVVGSVLGLGLGALLMQGLAQIQVKPPGALEASNMPLYWGVEQFALAAGFALLSALAAAWLPARKAANLHPVDILRGAA
ncbi:lipoprotein-releasing system permease protein [Inhella inkyongensis]|uniref:Lipoprotein-releasing system permease protein n=1 Tax=Inhella inkyongensis TaxID=392593 RepID=A0A840S1F2_9BURK|nr:FtsX-like permease family protein [Inhella inkyongensis]MBB5202906.1 lipoprotein-releasing system permease protein [Inhella inkyongensis]